LLSAKAKDGMASHPVDDKYVGTRY
jgi:hypothetical protein